MMEDTVQSLPRFSDPEGADRTGLVAITETMSPQLLLAAYTQGIFPWSDKPVRWYSPHRRAIFVPEHVHLPRNLAKCARKAAFCVSFDQQFTAVMRACRACHQDDGVWISDAFVKAYGALHLRGYAHSVEVWQNERLVGGLYGVQVGGLFAGESMFYRVANASKVAFAAALGKLAEHKVALFDAQVLNDNTAKLGAVVIPRHHYLKLLRQAVPSSMPLQPSRW